MLKLRRPWDSQPQGSVEIDWSNPITQGLKTVILGGSAVNFANGTFVTSNGALTDTVGPSGKTWRNTGVAADYLSVSTDAVSSRTLVAVVTRHQDVLTAGARKIAYVTYGGPGGITQDFNLGNGFGAVGDINKPRFTQSSGTPTNLQGWIDGVLQSSTNPYNTALVNGREYVVVASGDNLSIGAAEYKVLGNGTYGGDVSLAALLIWNRNLSTAEKESFRQASDVYKVFASQTIWVPVSAGGGPTNYPVTLSESATSADACSVMIGFAPVVAEAVTALDTSSQLAALSAAIAETGSALDTALAVLAKAAAITEAASAVDTVNGSAAGDYAGTVTEAGSAADTSSQVASMAASITEAGSAADTSSNVASLSATTSETASAADTTSGTTTGDYAGTVTEAGSATDTQSNIASLTATTIEAASAADVAAASRAVAALIAEAMSAVDSATVADSWAASIDELVFAIDAASAISGSALTHYPSVIRQIYTERIVREILAGRITRSITS